MDIMEVFIDLSGDHSSEERSGNRFREENPSLRIASGDHRSIEGRYDHPTDHRSSNDVEIVFPFLTLTREGIREFILSENFPIKKPCREKGSDIASEVVEDLDMPIVVVEGRHVLDFRR